MTLILENALRSWDKKSADDISDVYLKFHVDSSFTSSLLSYLSKTDCQMAATWLLKHHFEQNAVQRQNVSLKVYEQLENLSDWQSKLHILQSMQYLSIPKRSVARVDVFVRQCLTDLNKFVRAWAYNGFYLLSRQYRRIKKRLNNSSDWAYQMKLHR